MSLLMDALNKAEKERNKVESWPDKKIEKGALSEPEALFIESMHPVEEKQPLDLSFLSLADDEKKDEPEASEAKEKIEAGSLGLNRPLELTTELPADLPLSDLIEEESELSSKPSVTVEPPAPKIESKKNYNIPVLGIAKKRSNQTLWFIGGGIVLLAALVGYYYFKSMETNNSYTTLEHDSLQGQKNYEPEAIEEKTEVKTIEILEKPKTSLVAEIKSVDKIVEKQKTVERVISKVTIEVAPVSIAPPLKDESIHVQREVPKIDYLQEALEQAFDAYQAGYMVRAEQQYRIALQFDPDHQDALLGMAVISQSLSNEQQAKIYYQKLLTLNPKNSVAMSGLISMQQGVAQSSSESHLKILLSEEPDAAWLHAALGAQYVAGSRWSEARQAFSKAYHYDSNNPDYSYNLAISLDHLGQTQAAIKYYKHALFLSNQFSAGFKKSVIESRLLSLSNWAKAP